MFQVPKKKRLFYKIEDDLHLLREVAGQNPFDDQERWSKFQKNLLEATGKEFTSRSIKERTPLLAERFAAKAATDVYKSGIEEEVSEVDDLLHAILLLMQDFKNKAKSKSQYQKGFDKRELAQNKTEVSVNKKDFIANNDKSNHYEEVIECIVVNDEGEPMSVCPDSNNITTTDLQEEVVPNIIKTPNKKVKERNGKTFVTPARIRAKGLKQTSIRYLEKKNDRCRELALAEKKFELESMERKRRLEMDQIKLEMYEKRLKLELDVFQNQQRLMEIAFETRC